MGFLSGLFGSSKSRSSSKPAKPTAEQLALQKQAVDVGALQLGNIQSQTEFQTGLFDQLMASLNRQQTIDSNLFGGSAPVDPRTERRNSFLQNQQKELEDFKRQLGTRSNSQASPLRLGSFRR